LIIFKTIFLIKDHNDSGIYIFKIKKIDEIVISPDNNKYKYENLIIKFKKFMEDNYYNDKDEQIFGIFAEIEMQYGPSDNKRNTLMIHEGSEMLLNNYYLKIKSISMDKEIVIELYEVIK
jgi:hypothetical protein